jgi:hypothetical protein
MGSHGKQEEQGIGNAAALEEPGEPDIGALEPAASEIDLFPGGVQGTRLISGNVVEY